VGRIDQLVGASVMTLRSSTMLMLLVIVRMKSGRGMAPPVMVAVMV